MLVFCFQSGYRQVIRIKHTYLMKCGSVTSSYMRNATCYVSYNDVKWNCSRKPVIQFQLIQLHSVRVVSRHLNVQVSGHFVYICSRFSADCALLIFFKLHSAKEPSCNMVQYTYYFPPDFL